MAQTSRKQLVTKQTDLAENSELTAFASFADFDPDSGRFWITLDRVLFHSLPAVVSKVLDVNGFKLNLENILASLETVQIGAYQQGGSHNHALSWTYPHEKQKRGPLLQLFYQLVQDTQEKLDEAAAQQTAMAEAVASTERLQQENDQLRIEIQRLSRELLAKEVGQAYVSTVGVKAREIKAGKIAAIDADKGTITIKLDRKKLDFPMTGLTSVAPLGALVQVVFHGGVPRKLLFLEQEEPLRPVLGEVLMVTTGHVTVRTEDRTRLGLKLSSQQQERQQAIRRGDRVVVFHYQQKPVSFLLVLPSQRFHMDQMVAMIIKQQLLAQEDQEQPQEGPHG